VAASLHVGVAGIAEYATRSLFLPPQMLELKIKIYACYRQVVQEKVQLLQQVLADLKESGSNETKSTAGDKHETALAMLQIEQAHQRQQLADAMKQLENLNKINPSVTGPVIVIGSLVKTNRGYFYISLALGKAEIAGIRVMALSPQSPLGGQMMGLTAGDSTDINNIRYMIEKVI
jgi:transcription elongation GreA/GreB family factor